MDSLTGTWIENEFPRSRRCQDLADKFGPGAVVALITIWCDLSASTTEGFTEQQVTKISKLWLDESVDSRTYLQFLVGESLLDCENNLYFSTTINKRKRRKEYERKWKQSGKSSGKESGNDSGKSSGAVYSLKSKVLSLDLIKEIATIPDEFDTDALMEWLEYKAERGSAYKPRGLKTLIGQWAKQGPAAFRAAVKHSMANNYAGLFSPNGAASGRKATTAEINANLLAQVAEYENGR